MKGNADIVLLLLSLLLCGGIQAKAGDEDELEVGLEFSEYDLEDACVRASDAEWNFLNGSDSDLEKLLLAEIDKAKFQKTEAEQLQVHEGREFSKPKLQRLFNFFVHPGAALLGVSEFAESRQYSIKLQELNAKTTLEKCDPVSTENPEATEASTAETAKPCSSLNLKQVERLLFSSRNESLIKDTWTRWFQKLESQNQNAKYDFLQQLSLLDMEAEANGEEDVSSYWLKQSEITWHNYDTALQLWREISPLYQKIRNFISRHIVDKYGRKVFLNEKHIPVHILGSLETDNWIVAAESLGALDKSETYRRIKSGLREKKMSDLYKMADNFTSELKIGELPTRFYRNSRFYVTSPTCSHKVVDFCKPDHELKAIGCEGEDVTLTRFLEANENIMRLKHLILAGREEENDDDRNGFLLREGNGESVLYEAVTSLSSLWALYPENLKKQNLVSNSTRPSSDEDLISLLLSALHIIPSLPYYLTADLWRIEALKQIDLATTESDADLLSPTTQGDWTYDVEKRDVSSWFDESEEEHETTQKEDTSEPTESSTTTETTPKVTQATQQTIAKIYDFNNITHDWWDYRGKLQGVSSPDGKAYADYLQDKRIIWNKPYISQFLGKIVQFQLLDFFQKDPSNLRKLQLLLKKGKSKPWETIAQDMFNITNITTEPLRKYFKPLEDFLDSGAMFQNKTPLFSPQILKLFPQEGTTSAPELTKKEAGTEAAEGSDAVLFTLGIAAAIGLVAMIITIARRRQRKRKQKEKRRKLDIDNS